jgi:leucyl-tRNA synthetase
MSKINKYRKKLSIKRSKELLENATYHERFFKTLLVRWKIKHYFQKVIFTDDYRFYIVDFYIPKYRTVIEIDGASHDTNKDYDKRRTERLKKSGIRKVVRFKNNEVVTTDPDRLRELLIVNLLA